MMRNVQINLFVFGFFTVIFNYSFAKNDQSNSSDSLYKETLPQVLCQDDQYFIHCFSSARKNCKSDIIELADLCLELNKDHFKKLKKEMNEERAKLAENIKMGYCIGIQYEKKNASNKKDEPKCYSQKNW